MRALAPICAGLALGLTAAPALAEGPEQLDQLEPGDGEWQAEYFGTFGRGGEREHALEAMYGISGRLALGVELEAEYEDGELALETLGVKALYRLSGEDAPIAVGLQVQLGFDSDATLAEAEARLITEARSDAWWTQGNVMLRRSSEEGEASAGLAYGWSLQHSITAFAWLGLEGSGQSAPLWRDAGATAEHGHFAGPSLTFDWEPAPEREVEIGLAYFRRIGGDGPRNSGRLFVQLSF